MSQAKEIRDILDTYPNYQETLFRRGYLITDREIENLARYPFYDNWNKVNFGSLYNGNRINIYYHKLQDCYMHEQNGVTISIIGHAYNPFNMNYKELDILKNCLCSYLESKEVFFDKISELTGIHIIVVNDKGKLIVVQDCAGMKSCYFGKVDNVIYITSHPQLVGDICNLTIDPFVDKLVKTRCYNIGNRHLPGNITPFRELKRLGGNTCVEYTDKFNIKRFYPVRPHDEISDKDQFNEMIEKIGNIMHRNIELCSKKWNRPAISLSGGTDSKTTLACANGLYDKFDFFSFHSKPQELVDANAAHNICEKIGLEHIIYSIPDSNDNIQDFDILKKVIEHNTSYVKNTADHEIRKMIYLYRLDKYDVELKSWASEIARVSLERRYGFKMPKVLNERHFSIFQTRYFLVPNLLKRSDMLNKKYMKEIGLDGPIYNFEHTDLFHWEVRLGIWGTSVVSELDFCHNVTMPFNNRKLIELLLSFSHDDRRDGKVHQNIILKANKNIDEISITIKNKHSRGYRQTLERIYYLYRTIFYKTK
jgi:hypothetical protein